MFKAKFLIALANLICFLVTQSAFSAPWGGYGETKKVRMYSDDPASQEYYQFGVSGTYLGYIDPDFSEGLYFSDRTNPLLNQNYSSYNIIVLINKFADADFGRAQTMRVYKRDESENGGLLYYWYISTGIRGYETPRGFFTPQSFSSRHWSKPFDAPMLNSVFFSGGKALHTSIDREALSKLGLAFSHGCVHIEDHRAKEVFHLIGQSGYGKVNLIGGKTGKLVKDQNGDPIQILSYKTLIIVH